MSPAGAPAGHAARLAALLTSRVSAHQAATIDADLTLAAVGHGVAPLIYHKLLGAALLGALEPEARDTLSAAARQALVLEEFRKRHLTMVLGELERQGVQAIVFKGAALACTHYPEPWVRPRGDTDLLVAPTSIRPAMAVLERIGLTRVARPEGSAVTQQARFESDDHAVETSYDLHWRLTDPHVFADVLPFDDLLATSQPWPHGPGRMPDDVRALVIACVHRAAHHHDLESLIVLYVLHVISRSLDVNGWQSFVALASRYQIGAVCLRGLELAIARFSTPVPWFALERLRGLAAGAEPSAVYARPGTLRKIDVLYSDLRALPDWRARSSLLGQHLFPSAEYMRRVFEPRPSGGLALLYARRAVTGALRWCRRS